MVNKSKKKHQKRKQQRQPPPPPPQPQSTTPPEPSENDISSIPLPSPQQKTTPEPSKVLLTSSKCNQPKPDAISGERSSEVRKHIRDFTEQMRSHCNAAGTLDLDRYINGDDLEDRVIIVNPYEDAAGAGVPENVETAKIHVMYENGSFVPKIVPNSSSGSYDVAGTSKQQNRKESESSTTESAESVDDSHMTQVLKDAYCRDFSQVEVIREDSQYLNIKPSPQPTNPVHHTTQRPREKVVKPPREIREPENDYDSRTYRAKKRPHNGNGTTILKPPKFEHSPSTLVPIQQQPPPQEPRRMHQTLPIVQDAVDRRFHYPTKVTKEECALKGCQIVPSVMCPTCKRLIYCTERHRKLSKKSHEVHCIAYRKLETKQQGLHTIAARDIKRTNTIITDEPIIILPMNPSLTSRSFPRSYCIKCFVNNETDAQPQYYKCQLGCELPTCNRACRHSDTRRTESRVPFHSACPGKAECEYLNAAYKRGIGKHHFITLDQSVLGMLRCIQLLEHDRINDHTTQFFELLTMIKPGTYTKNFESKLVLIKQLLQIDAVISGKIKDEQLYKLDQLLLRFGRNVGPDVAQYFERKPLIPTYTRCIYPNLTHVLHSCVPNSVLIIMDGFNIQLVAKDEIAKGDMLTYCYDERTLFMPTRERRRFLLREFGVTCKCKRCISNSELDTYFSSYPCSKPMCRGFLVSDNPLDEYSTWMCNRCKRSTVPYIRIIDATFSFEEELEVQIKQSNPLALLDLMNELVNENYLHWNHHLMYKTSIKLLCLLWEALGKNDLKVMEAYSKNRGQQFLKPAESVINVTRAFLPDGYANCHVLPLRLAAVIKLRHLTTQLERKETTLEKIDTALNYIYFRGYDISKSSLSQRIFSTSNIGERYMKVMESHVIHGMVKVAMLANGKDYAVKARALHKMYEMKQKEVVINELIASKDPRQCIGMFPWDLKV